MGKQLLKDWKFRDLVASPVLVNLISAFILFVTVVAFKAPIYELVGFTKDYSYPIRVISEPYEEEGRLLSVDIFFVNLSNKVYTEKGLQKFINDHFEEGTRQHPEIKVAIRRGYRNECKIIDVQHDTIFNDEKGDLRISTPENDSGDWQLHINKIFPNTILKTTVKSNCKISATLPINRRAHGRSKVKIEGAGAQ